MNVRNSKQSGRPEHQSAIPPRSSAFSLIEFVGVLAILAILAAAAAPVLIRRIDQAARSREINDLGAISNALTLHILSSNTVPSATTWATSAATWMGLPVSGITQNPRGHSRVLFIDTNGWLGSVSLPYSQGVWGTTNAPTQSRMMIVSCLSGTNGVSQTSGPLAANLFNDIWNTAAGSKPSTWTTWNGNVEDLLIQRLNLQPLFHQVLLFNQTNQTSSANLIYAINGTTNVVVPSNAIKVSSYYLRGSVLGLYYSNGGLQATEIINRDLSRLYGSVGLSNSWGDQPGPGPGGSSTFTSDIDNLAYAFVNSPSMPVSKKGDNTYGAADMLLAYMVAYNSWASMNPCFIYTGVGNDKKVPEYQLLDMVVTCFGGSASGNCTIVP